MKIINKSTGETIATITTNHSMTIEEACDLAGIKLMVTKEDWEAEDGYDVNDLDMVYGDSGVTLNGHEVSFDACVNLMDDEIRETLHAELAPCTNQEFLDSYVEAHAAKYDGEVFEV